MKIRVPSDCKEHMLDEWEQLNSHVLAEKLDTYGSLYPVIFSSKYTYYDLATKRCMFSDTGANRYIAGDCMYNSFKENGIFLKTRRHDVTLADGITSRENLLVILPVTIKGRTFEIEYIIRNGLHKD
ncbi:hypothetical protein CEXT_345471 [Caerostris extrusa]|uniref:Uncharacterized protein n=1 Tax=Caerostris extrusa TaxID=172846 RepID=A0AAV4R628_CAEEX|nr:hypothetical protein CEXT_345471 [Caerostris extrusa]